MNILILKIILHIIAVLLGIITGLCLCPYVSRYLDRRKINVSRQGIHFVVYDVGTINAHWIDFIGQGLSNDFSNRVIRSMLRFWISLREGIVFIIKGDW